MDLKGANDITSVIISHMVGLMLGSSHPDQFLKSVWLAFHQRKKVPEREWDIPPTYTYLGAFKWVQSVIYGFNYCCPCKYESIHMRKAIFKHFSSFRFTTLIFVAGNATYRLLCWLVGWLVGQLVRWSVGWSVYLRFFFIFEHFESWQAQL